jgi:hypothetical protein
MADTIFQIAIQLFPSIGQLTSHMTDSLSAELLDHPKLSRWVSVNSLLSSGGPPSSTLETIRSEHRALISSLRDFSDSELIGKPTQSAPPISSASGTTGFARRVYHQLLYIDHEIAQLNDHHRTEMIKLFDTIIQYLTRCTPTDNGIYATVNRDSLFRFARAHPRSVLLRRYADFRIALVGSFRPILTTEEDIRYELIQVVEFCGQGVDARTSFYPHNRMQRVFEKFIMSDKLPFSAELTSLIESFPSVNSHRFLDRLFRLVVECLVKLGINRKPNDAALVLLLIRYVFDRVYDVNPFFREPGPDVIGDLSSVVMGQLSPPTDFLPPFDENMKVVEFFRADTFFSQSIAALEMAVFQTNGFDVLDCVEKALTHIERAAFHYNKGATIVFPFEVTFAFFLGVLISSQI